MRKKKYAADIWPYKKSKHKNLCQELMKEVMAFRCTHGNKNDIVDFRQLVVKIIRKHSYCGDSCPFAEAYFSICRDKDL